MTPAGGYPHGGGSAASARSLYNTRVWAVWGLGWREWDKEAGDEVKRSLGLLLGANRHCFCTCLKDFEYVELCVWFSLIWLCFVVLISVVSCLNCWLLAGSVLGR